jgi:formylglycine-generating enzyme required for sulfatase activity
MESLQGAERLILQTIHDLKGNVPAPVEDAEVARKLNIPRYDVSNCFLMLQEKGYVNVIVTNNGRSAEITFKGIQVLRQLEATSTPTPTSSISLHEVVFKGLRAFDRKDADFYLELLPGSRGPDGLPECVRFWKYRIEETDPDKTFRVGLLYGPSGCGKSSLMEAGILPILVDSVIPVYIEATAADTENRLLNALRRYCPTLPPKSSLLSMLQKKDRIPEGKKVLIILDQFEQWLHSKSDIDDSVLLKTLSECDGEKVQCILMVRDDFWCPVSRFLKQLGIQQQEGKNMQMVDLFDQPHAKKVLTAFGAMRCDLSDEQNAFLDQAVAGLAEKGKVICVRLALFAQMVKGKPWTPTTLKEVGGAEGIGYTFLEEAFAASTAPPHHRLHRKAAQAVLKALLPEAGTDIKGRMRSKPELLEASGYTKHPEAFDELLGILDSELRLITPTDPERNEGADESMFQAWVVQKSYQLAHDYLVPSLREWLVRKQKETKEGRAQLSLEDCANLWYDRQDHRLLPSLNQWIDILSFTSKTNWTDRQRKMMEEATKYHAMSVQDRVLNVNTTDVLTILEQMKPYRHFIDDLLQDAFRKAGETQDARKQLHASLALLPVDPRQTNYLFGRLLDAEPQEIPVIRDALASYKDELEERLWTVLRRPGKQNGLQRLRAASALATYVPDSKRWKSVQHQIVNDFVEIPAVYLATWIELLRPVRDKLLAAIANVFRDRQRRETERSLATHILAEYAADKPTVLADLLMDSEKEQFAVLYSRLQVHGDCGLAILQAEVAKAAPLAHDAKERQGKRQANAAVALLRMNQPEKVWPLLKHRSDPRVRSYLIHRFGSLGVDVGTIIQQLHEESDPSIRRALILSLGPGEFDDEAWTPEGKELILQQLKDMYRTADDPGLHAAAEWLLRTWKQEDWLKQINEEWAKDAEQRDKRLDCIKQLLTNDDEKMPPQWYVNGQGQTMVVISGSVQVLMGSPLTEEGRQDEERQHNRWIGRTFALSAKSVTVEQYRQFDNHFERGYELPQKFTRTANLPVVGINWFMAAAYCNWLSNEEGISEDQWCYEIKGQTTKLKADYLRLTGYRLPTETEMEYGTRAGALTSRYYGESEELLPKYAWYIKNSQEQTWPVGSLKPNDLGLFDVHGNVYTWCQESYTNYINDNAEEPCVEEDAELVSTGTSRVLRGGSFFVPASYLRSAYRFNVVPTYRFFIIGFRLAKTISQATS